MRLKNAITLLLTGAAFIVYSASAFSKTPFKCDVIEFSELSSLSKSRLLKEYCTNKNWGDLASKLAETDANALSKFREISAKYGSSKKDELEIKSEADYSYNIEVSQNCEKQQERILRVLSKKKIGKPSCE